MAEDGELPSLKALEHRIAKARRSMHPPENPPERRDGLALAFRLMAELFSCVAVGMWGGWWLDAWLDTKPLAFLGGLFLGAAAGLFTMIRTMGKQPSGPNGGA